MLTRNFLPLCSKYENCCFYLEGFFLPLVWIIYCYFYVIFSILFYCGRDPTSFVCYSLNTCMHAYISQYKGAKIPSSFLLLNDLKSKLHFDYYAFKAVKFLGCKFLCKGSKLKSKGNVYFKRVYVFLLME